MSDIEHEHLRRCYSIDWPERGRTSLNDLRLAETLRVLLTQISHAAMVMDECCVRLKALTDAVEKIESRRETGIWSDLDLDAQDAIEVFLATINVHRHFLGKDISS